MPQERQMAGEILRTRWSGLLTVILFSATNSVSYSNDADLKPLLADVEKAIASDDYSAAQQMLGKAQAAARAARDPELQADLQDLRKRCGALEREFNRLRAARTALMAAPDDPRANTALGRFYCFWKEDWQHGLRMLAIGDDARLREAARLDLSDPGDVDRQVRLGDLWVAAAENRGDAEALQQSHVRARRWYLRALQQLADDADPAPLHERLDSLQLFPSRIVLWNTHNGGRNDRGTLLCQLTLLQAGESVFQRRLPLSWSRDRSVPTTVRLPRLQFDQLRIDVLQWHGLGGGLAEVEVYDGNTNLALGAAVAGDSSPDIAFRPDRLTDGNRGGATDQDGIWLLSNGMPGTIQIHLNRN